MKTVDIFSVPVTIDENFVSCTTDDLNTINSFEYEEKANLNFFTKDYDVLSKLPKIKEHINSFLDYYGKNVLGLTDDNSLYVTNSWCVKTPKGGYHPSHSHPNSILSGVIYIDVGNTEQHIIFEHENQLLKKFDFLLRKERDTMYNTNKFALTVKNNDMIIFPSWIKHEVLENKTDTTRFVLRYNVFIKGKMGNDNYPTELNI